VNPEQGRVEHKHIPVTPRRDIDILFLVDDSPSMNDKQLNLVANFPNFINVLNTIEGGLPNVHIGVATSDLGSKGADDAAPGPSIGSGPGACSGNGKSGNLTVNGAPVMGNFVSDIKLSDGTRQTNYTGNLTDVFTTMAHVGATGCGFEQHIEAAKRALNNNPANAGFLRPDAFLAVIIIADEDDCSMAHSTLIGSDPSLGALQSFRCTRFGITCDVGGADSNAMNQVGTKDQCHSNDGSQYLTKISDYVTFFKGLKANATDVIVAAITGTNAPFQVELRPPPGGGTAIPALAHSCNYTDSGGGLEVADPPIRISQFLAQFPNRNTQTTICQQDLSGGLQQIAQLLKLVIGSPCIDGKLQGPPYDCSVSDVTNEGKPNQTESIIPECDASMSNEPCWHIISDPMNCTAGDHLTLKIERSVQPPPDTDVEADCVTVAQ
jgi:hypothetical protein